MKARVTVVHWMPLEMYPPAMNLVRYLSDAGNWEVVVQTTARRGPLEVFSHPGVKVLRLPGRVAKGAFQRALSYLIFQLGGLINLVHDAPDIIIYIEPQSSFPVFLYSFLRPKIPLFVHHHEYHEPKQFLERGMRLARAFHWLESKRIFKRAVWISHTNQERLGLFLRDQPQIDPNVACLLPNLPPASWFEGDNHAWNAPQVRSLRMVYVGSLSRQDTYIEELINWIQKQPEGSVSLDIYAYNLHEETREFLNAKQGNFIKFFPNGVNYDDLPALLRGYHMGVILYKAKTTNYRFNASNKLFEYLACGLDVLFPDKMLGVKPFVRSGSYPRVIETNFEDGSGPELAVLADRGSIPAAPPMSNASDVLGKLKCAMERHIR